MSGALGTLLEPSHELGALRRALEDARAGRGGYVLVEGPAGIGKSSPLESCGEIATELGTLP
jgi:hypothetical protein